MLDFTTKSLWPGGLVSLTNVILAYDAFGWIRLIGCDYLSQGRATDSNRLIVQFTTRQ